MGVEFDLRRRDLYEMLSQQIFVARYLISSGVN
jgi:hypothetical protein